MTSPDKVSSTSAKDTPNLWAGPLFFLLLLAVPVGILVFSNTDSAQLNFAGLEWSAPLWVIAPLPLTVRVSATVALEIFRS